MSVRTGASESLRRIVAVPLLSAVLAACSSAGAPSAPSPTGSLPAHAEVTQGQFEVQFDLPKTLWRSDETLTGQAQLRFLGQGSTTIAHAASLFGFEVAEVGGNRKVQPAWATSCQEETISAASPLTSGLVKSGALDTPFAKDFLGSPEFRLPAGTWDITAIAPFDPAGCGQTKPGTSLQLEATIRVQVVATS